MGGRKAQSSRGRPAAGAPFLIGVLATGSSKMGTVDAFKSESRHVRAVRGGS